MPERPLPPNAAEMPDGSVKYCGVGVLGDVETPCVLEPGHDGPCDFGPGSDG